MLLAPTSLGLPWEKVHLFGPTLAIRYLARVLCKPMDDHTHIPLPLCLSYI